MIKPINCSLCGERLKISAFDQADWNFSRYFNQTLWCFSDVTFRALELSFFIIHFSKSYKFFFILSFFKGIPFSKLASTSLAGFLNSKLFFEDALGLVNLSDLTEISFLSFRLSEFLKASCALGGKIQFKVFLILIIYQQ